MVKIKDYNEIKEFNKSIPNAYFTKLHEGNDINYIQPIKETTKKTKLPYSVLYENSNVNYIPSIVHEKREEKDVPVKKATQKPKLPWGVRAKVERLIKDYKGMSANSLENVRTYPEVMSDVIFVLDALVKMNK